jgi:hypothetical protein
MEACTRCGRWHADAEKVLGRRLSCSDVKRYWSKIREEHLQSTGHPARITTDDAGNWICMKCRFKL